MNNENLKHFDIFYKKYNDKFNFLIKTYPRDYFFFENENENEFNGIQKRSNNKNMPDYEMFSNKYSKIIVIESQDHYNVSKYNDKIINFSGSSVSWEILLFCDKLCYTLNFSKQPYYKSVSYLPNYIKFPDDISNIEVSNLDDILKENENLKNKNKEKMNTYILNEFSLKNMANAIKKIISLK